MKKTMLLLIEWHFSPIDYVILTELISFASSDEIGLFRSILNLENVHTYHVTVVARTLFQLVGCQKSRNRQQDLSILCFNYVRMQIMDNINYYSQADK